MKAEVQAEFGSRAFAKGEEYESMTEHVSGKVKRGIVLFLVLYLVEPSIIIGGLTGVSPKQTLPCHAPQCQPAGIEQHI